MAGGRHRAEPYLHRCRDVYKRQRPAYDTAFLFLGERFDDANVPPWAMKVVLDEEEFTGAAARPQSTLADALAEEDDLYRDLNNS